MQLYRNLSKYILIFTLSLVLVFSLFSAVVCTTEGVKAQENLTSQGLVEHVKRAYDEKWDYVWGGQSAGEVDCSGLIYSYGHAGGSHSSDAMYKSSTKKGAIGTIPEKAGLGLWSPGHVGVYIGNGMAIDALNSSVDIRYASIGSGNWKAWFEISGIDYSEKQEEIILNTGDSGEEVLNLQNRLVQLEYLSTDEQSGIYDENTKNAVLKFEQSENKIADGALDEESNEYLFSENATMNPETIVVQEGSKSEEVAQVQQKLYELRYTNEKPNGIYDEDTQEAIKKYQANNGEEQSGNMDRQSEEKLLNDNSVKKSPEYNELELGYTGDDVAVLNEQLSQIGYNISSENTDDYSKFTQKAICNFQKENDIKVTGVADEETRAKLSTVVQEAQSEEKQESPFSLIVFMILIVAFSSLVCLLYNYPHFFKEKIKKIYQKGKHYYFS